MTHVDFFVAPAEAEGFAERAGIDAQNAAFTAGRGFIAGLIGGP